MPTIRISDFSGGLNLRDSPFELAPSETPDVLNWVFDQRGAIRLRKGCSNVGTLPGVSGKNGFPFYSALLDQWLCVRETAGAPNTLNLYTRPTDLSSVWTSRGVLNTVGNNPISVTCIVGFIDFPGGTSKVIIASADVFPGGTSCNVHTWDGTTLSNLLLKTGGHAIALWQNRGWIAGYPFAADVSSGNNYTRLFGSAIGDGANWPSGVGTGSLTNDLRDKDGQRLTGLGIAAGALAVFKKRSAYRVNDSNTAAYSTIDSAAGAQGPLAVVGSRGRLYTWGADSLYEWDGVGPGRRVGDKARPLFATDPALVGGVPGLCGGVLEDRPLFAYPSVASGDNDRLLDYDPQHGWLTKYQLAGSSKTTISSFASKEADLYAAVKNGDVMFKLGGATAGADDGTLFANNYRTAWIEPNGGKLCRILRAQIEGLLVYAGTNTLKFRVYKDGDLSTYTEFDVTSDLRASSATDAIQEASIRALGHARSFAFEFVAGTAAGDAAVFGLTLDWQPLER